MTDATQNQLISDIAHELITEIAPGELPLFPVTSEVYFENLDKGLKLLEPTDEMLGFGSDTAITFLTPVVLALTTKVVIFLADKVRESIKEASGELVTKFIKEMFKSIPPTEEQEKKTPLILSREQLSQLRQLIFETAKHLRLPSDKTESLVNAIVTKLVIGDT
jgi:hypothetical protein